MQSKATLIFTTTLPTACLLALGACGGGGGGSSSTPTPTPTPTPAANVSITGVAAIGAPLVAATVKAVDATGAAVKLLDASGNTIPYAVTNVADGSYTLNLATATPSLPLLIEAAGTDGTGTPVLLHSLVQANTPLVANITPLTDAVVAEILGENPQTVFQNASSNVSAIAALGSASILSAATSQIKTIIGANLTAAKITSPSSLNLFSDSTFTTDKLLLDAAIEGLRVQIVKDDNGNDQLQLSNKFVPIQEPEVEIDLATAKAQLAKGSAGTLANAIVSTSTTTTSATSSLTNISSLDGLTAALNTLIAQQAGTSVSSATYTSLLSATPAPPSPPPATGVKATYAFNGRDSSLLEQLFTNYATTDYQLTSMNILGCVDDPLPSKGCVNLAISSVVTNPSGTLVDVYSDGVAYSKTTTPNWMISGNGRYATIGVYPVAYAVFGFNGSLTTSSTSVNPATGVQVSIQAQDNLGNETVVNAEAQMPSGQSVPFAYCGISTLCLATNPAVQPVATGDLSDTLLQQSTIGWVGNTDAAQGAKYVVSYAALLAITSQGPNTNQTANAYLSAAVPANLGVSLFPAIDGVSATAPLSGATIVANSNNTPSNATLTWATWAAANPNMRVFSVRTVVVSTGSPSVITDNPVPLGFGTSVTLQPIILPSGFTPTSYEIWIGAVDNLGHRYYTQYVGTS